MNLQNIIWPQVEICNLSKMYYRYRGNVKLTSENVLEFSKHGIVKFDTYFNGFSIDKWKKYTYVNNVSITLLLQGKFEVSLFSKEKVGYELIKKQFLKEKYDLKEVTNVTLSFPENAKGMLYFKLEALEDNAKFYKGFYGTNNLEGKSRPIKIAIDICTFRREEFIKKNMLSISKYILENPSSPLYEKLDIFISDNGKTLGKNSFSSNKIHIFDNKNVGGAGGFTRGLIEILRSANDGNQITHVLLMDDDILLDPEVLVRTYVILSLLKPEYENAFIGGAMLRNDKQNIQVESGAIWNAGKLVSLKAGLDVSKSHSCVYNEIEEYCEYNAWWYCCIPMGVVRESNLPLPIFIRGDDVEYGLRNKKNLILINGICVWHEPFENKYSSSLFYYILRNQAIDNALHCQEYTKKDLRKDLWNRAIRELMLYRYKNVHLLIQGVDDFLKGIDWLETSDGEKIHQEIMKKGYSMHILEELEVHFSYPEYDRSLLENDNKIHRVFRLATLNGYLLPTLRNNIVSTAFMRPYNAYRTKKILNYDVTSKKGFVTEKDIKELVRCICLLLKMSTKINRRYDDAKRSYQTRREEIQNIEFWKKYLQMKI